jgi:hypothetical protein
MSALPPKADIGRCPFGSVAVAKASSAITTKAVIQLPTRWANYRQVTYAGHGWCVFSPICPLTRDERTDFTRLAAQYSLADSGNQAAEVPFGPFNGYVWHD